MATAARDGLHRHPIPDEFPHHQRLDEVAEPEDDALAIARQSAFGGQAGKDEEELLRDLSRAGVDA